MGTAGIPAAYESVQRIQPVHEIRFDQEFQSSVDGWRCGPATFAIKAVKDIVRPCRLMASPYQLQHSPPQSRQSQATITTDLLGAPERGFNTIVVIMMRRGERCCSRCTVHGEHAELVPNCTRSRPRLRHLGHLGTSTTFPQVPPRHLGSTWGRPRLSPQGPDLRGVSLMNARRCRR